MVFDKHVPDWFYEPFPYLCFAIGLATIVVLRSSLGTLCGVMLVLAGALLWKMRRDYRSQNGRARSRKSRDISSDSRFPANETGSLVQMIWNSSLEVGHDTIDRQHRRLFFLCNQLIDAILAEKPKADIELLVDEMMTKVERHFRTEEQIMAEIQYPSSDEHKDSHADLLARARELREKFEHGRLPPGELIGFIAYDVVSQHIAKGDAKLAPLLARQ